MKKINSAIALCGLALCGCSATGATAEEVGLTDAQISSIASFFAAPIKSVATITPRYAAFGGATFTATDEVSSTARHSDLCLTGTKMPLLQSDVTASPEGYVMLNTLGLDNVVKSTEVTNDSNLPDKYGAEDADYGHVTKGAAYALRGKVYLWKKEWKKAADDFEAVKKCGYSLYTASGAESYKQLFKEENERCDEMIFSLQCSSENDGECASVKNGSYGTRSMPDDGTGTGIGWTNYIVNPCFVDTYENADGSKFDWNDHIPGYNEMSPEARSVYFLRDDATEDEKELYRSRGADMSKYVTPGNEDRIKRAYASRDPRLAMSVITPYSTYLGGRSGTPAEYTMRVPYREVMAPVYDLQTDVASMAYYVNRKFVGEGMEAMTFYSSLDLPFIRYAEVLLNWAEALNELGDTPEAINKVNEVRNRAGAQPLDSNAATAVGGKDDMRQRIMNECHWELLGEDVVFFDEIRWKTWKDLKFYKPDGGANGMCQVWGANTYSYTWGGTTIGCCPFRRARWR